MAQLNAFGGGLSTRLAPHLINVDEAQIYVNIDNSSAILKPANADLKHNIEVHKYFINFHDSWISSSLYRTYLQFKDKLYYSDGAGVPQKSDDGVVWYNLGITKPSEALKVEAIEMSVDLTETTDGDFAIDTYNYKICSYVDDELSIRYEASIDIEADEAAITIGNIQNIDGTIYIYREFEGVYRLVASTDGTYIDDVLDISANDSLPDDTKKAYLSGVYQYSYTYYNTADGTESEPSEFSSEVDTSYAYCNVSGFISSDDAQVSDIRLYRVGGELPTMSLVITLSSSVTLYSDTTGDLNISGAVLDSYNNGQAPKGLDYLTEYNTMLFGVVKDKLWFSGVAFVNNWSAFNFIDFEDTITGLGSIANGLLVFTKFKTYIVTGTSPTTLSKYLLNANQGCVSHNSIQYIDNNLIWVSTDGICITSGGQITVISRPKLTKQSVPNYINDSIVYDDVYYIAHSTGILALDFRYGSQVFKEFDTVVDGFSIYNDILYYSKNSLLYSFGESSDKLSIHYKSPKLSDGSISNLKNYKNVYVKCTDELEFTIYIDGEPVITKTINAKTSEVLVPQSLRTGYYIEFELTGKGTLLELQYIAERRQNGR